MLVNLIDLRFQKERLNNCICGGEAIVEYGFIDAPSFLTCMVFYIPNQIEKFVVSGVRLMKNNQNESGNSTNFFKVSLLELSEPLICLFCSFGFYAIAASTPDFSTDGILLFGKICIGASMFWSLVVLVCKNKNKSE
ncbi:hypothetical protein [Pseudoalteromonas sp. MQS005]|uniref:hypothetical protein n=1 Tax=Pseudoalteromonas sp. MQS005 TaxID=1854052 RepID=UPI0007E4FA28|nr:hypothetical protein [Pseudoalteromonas sp. MQS005]